MGIQILRGVAACAVLVHHVLEESQPLYDGAIPVPLVLLGASGVDLFFVISGFIMFHTNRDRFGHRDAPVAFFRSRIVRIAPLYWFCTAAIVVAASFAGLYAHKTITIASVAGSMLFIPSEDIVLGAGWTLNYEMYFYSVFALWMLSGRLSLAAGGIIGSIVLVMVAGTCLPPGAAHNFLGNPIALEFCFGLALAAALGHDRIPVAPSRLTLFLAAAAFALGTLVAPSHGTSGLTPAGRTMFWGIPATILLASALRWQVVDGMISKALLVVGNASYSIYLTHGFVMTAYAKLLKSHVAVDLPSLVWMALAILSSIALGITVYRVLEQPMTHRLRHAATYVPKTNPVTTVATLSAVPGVTQPVRVLR